MKRMITRIYSRYASADRAIRNLRAAGLSGGAITVLAGDDQGWHEPGGRNVDPRHDKNRDGRDDRAEGAVTGGSIGMVVGATAGFALGMHLIELPQVGPLVAAGWYAPVVIGAFAFGALGGMMGALAESGTSRENEALYSEALRRGGALVTARVEREDVEKYSVIMDRSVVEAERRGEEHRGGNLDTPALSIFAPTEPRPGDGQDLARTG